MLLQPTIPISDIIETDIYFETTIPGAVITTPEKEISPATIFVEYLTTLDPWEQQLIEDCEFLIDEEEVYEVTKDDIK
eukprot:14956564-Ditylum_brightwellii.AAC.1